MTRRHRRDRVYDALAQAAPDLPPTVLRRQVDAVMQQVVVPLAADRDAALSELYRLRRTNHAEEDR